MLQTAYNRISGALLIALTIYILCSRACSAALPDPLSVEVIKIDTITFERVDTVWQHEVVYLPTPIVPAPVEVKAASIDNPKPEPIAQPVSPIDSIRTYSATVEDSTVAITYNAEVRGVLGRIGHSYKLKAPRKITVYKDRVITKTEQITKPPRSALFVGGSVVAYQSAPADWFASVQYVTPRGLSLSYSYAPLSNSHQAGLAFRLLPLK